MANRKISDLTALTATATGDLLPIVDISEAAAADKNKKITVENLFKGIPGNVGIGTSSPSYPLHVVGQGYFSTKAVAGVGNEVAELNGGYVGLYNAAASNKWIKLIDDSSTINAIGFSKSGSTATTWFPSGNVGIGTTSPGVPLEVFGGNARVALASGSSATFRGYEFASATTVFGSIKAESAGGELRIESGFATFGGYQTFYTNGSERARIDSSGRLLVGTSSDSGGALLQVNGDRIRVGTAKTPASASATGTTGEICWDANYIYVCTATNTWKRTAIATW